MFSFTSLKAKDSKLRNLSMHHASPRNRRLRRVSASIHTVCCRRVINEMICQISNLLGRVIDRVVQN